MSKPSMLRRSARDTKIFFKYPDEDAIRDDSGMLVGPDELPGLIETAKRQLEWIYENREEYERQVVLARFQWLLEQVAGQSTVGYVYFARANNLTIKIGFSKTPNDRVRGLGLTLISCAVGKMAHEQALHILFSQYCYEGEYFEISEDQIKLAHWVIEQSQ